MAKLPREAIPQLIKPNLIYAALSDAMRDVCIDTLCVREEISLTLEIGEATYPAADSIHRIMDVIVPGDWQPIDPTEPEKWNRILQQQLTGVQPVYCTMVFGEFRFTPTPTTNTELQLWVVLKPAEDWSDDLDEETDPITPVSYDEALVYGAMWRLVQDVPNEKLLDPNKDSAYYLALYKGIVTKPDLNKVQSKNPGSVREEFRF